MRKLIILALAIIALLSATSCTTQKPAITLSPSDVTIKVGESTQLHPGFEGDVPDAELLNIVRLAPTDGIVTFDKNYYVTGIKVGDTKVGVVVYNDPDDITKGYKYSAFTTVHVVN